MTSLRQNSKSQLGHQPPPSAYKISRCTTWITPPCTMRKSLKTLLLSLYDNVMSVTVGKPELSTGVYKRSSKSVFTDFSLSSASLALFK